MSQKGLDGRGRDDNGEPAASGATLAPTRCATSMAKTSPPERGGDMHLGPLLKRAGANSPSDYLKNKR